MKSSPEGGRAICCSHWQDPSISHIHKHSNTHSVCNLNVDCYAPALCFIPVPRASAFCCKICQVMLKEFLFSAWRLQAEMSTWGILFALNLLWFQDHCAWSVFPRHMHCTCVFYGLTITICLYCKSVCILAVCNEILCKILRKITIVERVNK